MKNKFFNKRLLLTLGVATSIATIVPTISCSKPSTNLPSNPNDNSGSNDGQNPGTNPGGDNQKPSKPLIKIVDEEFNVGTNNEWVEMFGYNLLSTPIDINEYQFQDENGKPIYYKLTLKVNGGRKIAAYDYVDESKYDNMFNFHKTMNEGFEADYVFWLDKRKWPIIIPLSGEIAKSDKNNAALLPRDKSFAYFIKKESGQVLDDTIYSEAIYLNGSNDRFSVTFFKSYTKYRGQYENFFSPEAKDVNQAICNENNMWDGIFNKYYKNLSGTISIEQIKDFEPPIQ